MHHPDTLVGAVLWLRPGPDGALIASDASGETSAGVLEPGLDELTRRSGVAHGARGATWHGADGVTRNLAVWSLPDLEGALAVDTAACLEQVADATSTLVNSVAHDVRNFAFTIALQTELAERRTDLAPDVKAHLGAVLRQVDALKAYLDRLLLFGRPARIAPAAIEVARFVRDLGTRFQFNWKPGASPLTVRTEIAPGCGMAQWDEAMMGKAIEALLDNAARAADPAPTITLSARAVADSIAIEVADDGPGIPPEALERLGTPMAVRRAGGAGLGIAIARKLVQAHGGFLVISPSHPGTVVRLVVPREAPPG